jgi:hypothetical protein
MTETAKTLAHYQSKTDSTTRHIVTVDLKTGDVRCSCRGFSYTGNCWHRERWVDRLAEVGYAL